jgi:hypothetical protein
VPDHPTGSPELKRRLLRTLSDATLTSGALRYQARFALRTTLSSRAVGPFPAWTLHAAQESPARTAFELRAFEQRADGGVSLMQMVVHDGRAFYSFDGERWGFLGRRMSEWSGLLPRVIGGAHRGLVDVEYELTHRSEPSLHVVRGRIDDRHAVELVGLLEMTSGGGLERALDAVTIEDARFQMEAPAPDASRSTAQLSFRAALPAYRAGAAMSRAQQELYLGFGRPEVAYSITVSLLGGERVDVTAPEVDTTKPRMESLVDAMLARVHGGFASPRARAGARQHAVAPRVPGLIDGLYEDPAHANIELPPLGDDDFGRV